MLPIRSGKSLENFPNQLDSYLPILRGPFFPKDGGKAVVRSGLYHCFSCLNLFVPNVSCSSLSHQIYLSALFCTEKWVFYVKELLYVTKAVLGYSLNTNPDLQWLLSLIITENSNRNNCLCCSLCYLLASRHFRPSPYPLFVLSRSMKL